MNKKDLKVILPGSYDPVTSGHLEIIRRAAERYDEVFAVVFINPEKTYAFSLDERVQEEWNLTHGGYPTEYIRAEEGYEHISSTLVREKIARGESLQGLLPEKVVQLINSSLTNA